MDISSGQIKCINLSYSLTEDEVQALILVNDVLDHLFGYVHDNSNLDIYLQIFFRIKKCIHLKIVSLFKIC